MRPPTQAEQVGVFVVAYAVTRLLGEWWLARQEQRRSLIARGTLTPANLEANVIGTWSYPQGWGQQQ